MSKIRLVKEFFGFIKSNNKIWLIPILLIMLVSSLVIFASQSQALAPFIYSLF